MKVRIIRGTLVNGELWNIGKTPDVPVDLARELVASGKAELVGDPPASSGPMTTKTATPIVEGAEAEEKKPAKPKKSTAGKEK